MDSRFPDALVMCTSYGKATEIRRVGLMIQSIYTDKVGCCLVFLENYNNPQKVSAACTSHCIRALSHHI